MDVFVPHTIRVSQLTAPPSKSYAQRAILAAALSDDSSVIHRAGDSSDVRHLLAAVETLGAEISGDVDQLVIRGTRQQKSAILHCGESGLATRLLASVAPAIGDHFELHGEGSILTRSMLELESFLPQLGVHCQTTNGHLPVILKGKLRSGTLTLDGSSSSQYLSGLLMALPLCAGNTVIRVNQLASKPYIDMTLDLLREFGIKIHHTNYEVFEVPGNQEYRLKGGQYTVEGDYSAAAFFLVLSAITGEPIRIGGLNENSLQADRRLIDLLSRMGFQIRWRHDELTLEKGKVVPFDMDATDCPDLFPCLVVLAASAQGESMIKGVHRLRNKESDRAAVLQHEFAKAGLSIRIEDDRMIVTGTGKLNSVELDSHNDHRIAMAGAIAAALTTGGMHIRRAEAVEKSFPGFWSAVGLSI